MTDELFPFALVQPRTYLRAWGKIFSSSFDEGAPPETQNLDDALDYLVEAASQGARYVVFPELYPGPMSPDSPLSLDDVTERLADQARESHVWVLYGGAEIVPEGMYNTYDAVSPSGHLAARYRKMIPACGEPWLPGQEPQVVDADGLRLGLCLCWEAWFPEIARTLTFLGADVILFPTGGLVHELGDRWRQVLAARAAENMVYTMASTNLLACEDGMAVINSPEGLVADARKQGIVYASVDIARLRYLRETDEELMVPKKYLSIPGLLRALPPQVAEHLQRAVTGFFEENR